MDTVAHSSNPECLESGTFNAQLLFGTLTSSDSDLPSPRSGLHSYELRFRPPVTPIRFAQLRQSLQSLQLEDCEQPLQFVQFEQFVQL